MSNNIGSLRAIYLKCKDCDIDCDLHDDNLDHCKYAIITHYENIDDQGKVIKE